MSHAMRVHAHGGPEVMRWESVDPGDPGPGEIRIAQRACGVNFIDTYFRTGAYPSPVGLPFIAGNEGAGEVVAVGAGVTGLRVGDRVAYVHPLGGYAEERTLLAERAVVLPDAIDFEQAAGMMLKGMTVQYLLRRTHRLAAGETILVQAAAGGVGLILCQWARSLGATVIGTVGSADKAELALAHGAHHAILYREEDFVARVRDLTGGRLCDVVYDGIGRATFPASLDCLRPLGLFVSYGSASGSISAFDIGLLMLKGSLFATRPSLNHYVARREDLVATAGDLFEVVADGRVSIPVRQRYALREAARAHRELEARETTGSTILLP